ncbi:MAG: hypothetical protein LQ347_006198 [Umbilicaria vellea]|nr:MAG: hypothetical protein LQ347_006198 [Umbilicaria vellea]
MRRTTRAEAKRRGKDGNAKGKGKGTGEGNVAEPEKEVDGLKEKKVKGKGKEGPEEKLEDGKKRVIYVDEDDGLTVKDLIYMVRLADRYEEEKWLKVASRFYDRTGRRVAPRYIAEKLAGG